MTRDPADAGAPSSPPRARAAAFLAARIIHGKGTGTLRRTVHAVVPRLPEVEHFELAGGDAGGWGATRVVLRAREPQ